MKFVVESPGESSMIGREQAFYRSFGRILAQRRSEANLSQAALAKAVGLSRTSITNIECGRQPVNLHTLYVMAGVLRRDLNDLLPPPLTGAIDTPLGGPRLQESHPSGRLELNRLSSKEFTWLTNIAKAKPQKQK
jgi:transcriptional regulator with XRE-family HTH domain